MRNQRKEQRLQQYEEAVLGLLLEEYADAEGERLLQAYEAASKDGTVAPMSDELNDKCRKLIKQAKAKNNRRKTFSGVAKTVCKAAVVALAVLGIASTAVLSVEAWRVPILNFGLNKSGDYTIADTGYSNPALQKQFEGIVDMVCAHAPFGYELTQTPAVDKAILLIQMKDSAERMLTITVRQDTSYIKVDTKDAEYTELDLYGKPAYYLEKGGFYIMWADNTQHLIYSVYAKYLTSDSFWDLVYALAE